MDKQVQKILENTEAHVVTETTFNANINRLIFIKLYLFYHETSNEPPYSHYISRVISLSFVTTNTTSIFDQCFMRQQNNK